MGFDTEKSFIMAERLKQLREEKGLSHEKLSKALSDQYGVKISSDSLINYEVADADHTKAYKNQGMRVEYLRCLADFYGVSSDYLLGEDTPKSPDVTIREIVERTGLSEESIFCLQQSNDLRNKRTITKEAGQAMRASRQDVDSHREYIYSRLQQDNVFREKMISMYGTNDLEKIADTQAETWYTDECDIITSDMAFAESIMLDALNLLISSEKELKILFNTALFLLSDTQKNAMVSFVATDARQNGMFHDMGAEFVVAGLLACVEAGLQELRKKATKQYTLCDFEGRVIQEALVDITD